MKKGFLMLCAGGMVFLSAQGGAQMTSVCDIHDQTAVEVTVYNKDLGLVKDSRRVSLPTGEGELRFMDVASAILPETVRAESVNQPEAFSILEQNYEYDLMNANKILDKNVGKKIKIIDWNKVQDRKDSVEAVLLSNNEGQVYEIDDEIYLGHPGYKVLPRLPENLIAKPTLTWLYENRSQRDHQLEVSYLTGNMSWKADYVVILDPSDAHADLSGWVTLDNQSGATYKNAQLKLVAGDVHRIRETPSRPRAAMETLAFADKAPQFEEKAFFEYHIYDLKRKTTIKDKQKKQIRLLEVGSVGLEKQFLIYGRQAYFSRRYRPENPKQPVYVYLQFGNTDENHLGMPLPGGIMRLYKQDGEGRLQFIGEDKVEHTAKNEQVRLKAGEAFDVAAERTQTEYVQITTQLHEMEWEIEIRNHKKEDIQVGVIESLFGNWQVIRNTHPYTKMDAFTLRFDVPVPKDGEATLRYRVRVGL